MASDMDLGAFSISLTVADLEASKVFYEKLGFEVFGGNAEMKYLMLKNGAHVIGLFEGMFDRNMLTFNPGWTQDGSETPSFTDVRELQKRLKAEGIDVMNPTDEGGSGPGSFVVIDPDGNPILVDQHR